jgi:hypothetical protein
MNTGDRRPPLSVAHIVLETDRMEPSAQFMRTIGMRPVFEGESMEILGEIEKIRWNGLCYSSFPAG